MTDHPDMLHALNDNIPLSEKLTAIHHALSTTCPAVARIAVAVYDPKTDLIKTFIHSSGGENPLSNYQARLSDTPRLAAIYASGRAQVVNDVPNTYRNSTQHGRKLRRQGYGSSYTLPTYTQGSFFGFVFFNAYDTQAFTPDHLATLNLYGHLVARTVIAELTLIHTMLAAVKTAREMTKFRDEETGAHLDRMARYARLIAKTIAPRHGFDDEYIERLFLFAPLHDLGKIGTPDHILLKKGALDESEFEVMKQHASKGRAMVDRMLAEFNLSGLPYVDVLRNITEHHHEKLDGSGYPGRLKDEAIPIEARIVAVADIFDALTSRRPYKPAWPVDQAFATLRTLAGDKLDRECVDALIDNRDEVARIYKRFAGEASRPGAAPAGHPQP
ncbi:MAG TPA: HD domain-containing protein [Gammaproteobacteria bacterium]|nr:HD domain-containing protein [Gammaproteobacteria bacterium]